MNNEGTRPRYSIVIPVYNSATFIDRTIAELREYLESRSLDYEIILVNDGSKDHSWERLCALAEENRRIVPVDLLKNYGQHSAIFTGFSLVRGDFVITMDDDAQNPPSEIDRLIEKIGEGYDIVFGKFREKKHSFFRRQGTKLIDYLNRKIFGKPADLALTNFRIVRREVIDRVVTHRTTIPYIPGLLLIYSGKPGNVLLEHRERIEGKSNYTMKKILQLVSRIVFGYSSYPLRALSAAGLFFSLAGFLYGTALIVKKLVAGTSVEGWTTIAVLISFFGGFIVLMLGMIGEYVVRAVQQLSGEQTAIVRETRNLD